MNLILPLSLSIWRSFNFSPLAYGSWISTRGALTILSISTIELNLNRIDPSLIMGMNLDIPMPFALIAFCALSIERLLYSYCFIFTDQFKQRIDRKQIPGISKLSEERCYWKCMQRLGMYIKIFQFGVVIYDLLVLDVDNVIYNISGGMLESTEKQHELAIGMLLIFIGQVLNYTTFQALGAKGVYYGYEFGYSVDRVTCFPYNLNINDPQYWGVVLCIFGIYMVVGASSFMVPVMELFWYMMSMKVFENERGVRWVKALTGFEKKPVCSKAA